MAKSDSLRPENSPSAPGVTDKPRINVRSLSPLPIVAFAVVVALVVGFIAYGIQKRGHDEQGGNPGLIANAGDQAHSGGYNEWLASVQSEGAIPSMDDSNEASEPADRPAPAPDITAAPEEDAPQAQPSAPSSSNQAPQRVQERENRMLAEIRQQRMEDMLSALASDTSVIDEQQGRNSQQGGQQGQNGYMNAASYGRAGNTQTGQPSANMVAMGGGQRQSEYQAQNMQGAKRDFLDASEQDEFRLNHTRQAQESPYSIKTGTVIPGVMISGINSDLPGRMIAQVSQNVYDTATGEHLMIPQGSRLYGKYDSNVAMGQERVLIVWNRIIYPDGSTLNLESMPGNDQEGFAGFHDQVDNHYWRTIGNALLLSVVSAGAQLSQPDSSSSDGYDANQILAAQLGQQFGQVGQEMIRRNMNIQPTLKIRKGYRFNVMVTKDIVAQPWQS